MIQSAPRIVGEFIFLYPASWPLSSLMSPPSLFWRLVTRNRCLLWIISEEKDIPIMEGGGFHWNYSVKDDLSSMIIANQKYRRKYRKISHKSIYIHRRTVFATGKYCCIKIEKWLAHFMVIDKLWHDSGWWQTYLSQSTYISLTLILIVIIIFADV